MGPREDHVSYTIRKSVVKQVRKALSWTGLFHCRVSPAFHIQMCNCKSPRVLCRVLHSRTPIKERGMGFALQEKPLGKVPHTDIPVPRQEGTDALGPAWPLSKSAQGVHGSDPPGRYKWSPRASHAPLANPCSPGAGWCQPRRRCPGWAVVPAHESGLGWVALSEGYRKWR